MKKYTRPPYKRDFWSNLRGSAHLLKLAVINLWDPKRVYDVVARTGRIIADTKQKRKDDD